MNLRMAICTAEGLVCPESVNNTSNKLMYHCDLVFRYTFIW